MSIANTLSYPSTQTGKYYKKNGLFKYLLFILLHIPLALLINRFHVTSTFYALAIFSLSTYIVLTTNDFSTKTIYCLAYITGVEVLWRITEAHVFWEFGKYLSVVLILLSLIRSRKSLKTVLPIFYFLLLVPSVILTLAELPINEARQQISFNLSGPLSLMMVSIFLYKRRFSLDQVKSIFLYLIAPIVGISIVTLSSTLSVSSINFSTRSNTITSAGIIPNQVSSILGLGAIVIFLYISVNKNHKLFNLFLLGLMLLFVTQSILTFSRNGIYLFLFSVATFLFIQIRSSMKFFKTFALVLTSTLIFIYFIFPFLNEFTNGMIVNRYSEVGVSNRDILIKSDLKIWQENLIFGVGPGMARSDRIEDYGEINAHTEFTRMLAEHGILGLVSLVILFSIAIRNIFFCRDKSFEKALVIVLLLWSFLYMSGNAMRLFAPSFLIGLSGIRLSKNIVIKAVNAELIE